MANSSQNCPRLKSITLPDSGPRIVPTGSLCNASTLRDSQSMFTASTTFVCPGACIATGIPFTRAIRIALEDFPAVKCPVKPSSTAVVNIDRTASVPPLPSRITCPSVSASPCEPIASTWPSINAAIWLISRLWSTSASVHTARAISPASASSSEPSPVCSVQWPAPSSPRSLAIAFLPAKVSPTWAANMSAGEGKSPASSISIPESTAIPPLTSGRRINCDSTAERSLESSLSSESPAPKSPLISAACSNASGMTSATEPSAD